MNWVGGSRKRITQTSDQKQQRDYFKRKREEAARCYSTAEFESKPASSRDLVTFNFLNIKMHKRCDVAKQTKIMKHNLESKDRMKIRHVDIPETPPESNTYRNSSHHSKHGVSKDEIVSKLDKEDTKVSSSYFKIPEHRKPTVSKSKFPNLAGCSKNNEEDVQNVRKKGDENYQNKKDIHLLKVNNYLNFHSENNNNETEYRKNDRKNEHSFDANSVLLNHYGSPIANTFSGSKGYKKEKRRSENTLKYTHKYHKQCVETKFKFDPKSVINDKFIENCDNLNDDSPKCLFPFEDRTPYLKKSSDYSYKNKIFDKTPKYVLQTRALNSADFVNSPTDSISSSSSTSPSCIFQQSHVRENLTIKQSDEGFKIIKNVDTKRSILKAKRSKHDSSNVSKRPHSNDSEIGNRYSKRAYSISTKRDFCFENNKDEELDDYSLFQEQITLVQKQKLYRKQQAGHQMTTVDTDISEMHSFPIPDIGDFNPINEFQFSERRMFNGNSVPNKFRKMDSSAMPFIHSKQSSSVGSAMWSESDENKEIDYKIEETEELANKRMERQSGLNNVFMTKSSNDSGRDIERKYTDVTIFEDDADGDSSKHEYMSVSYEYLNNQQLRGDDNLNSEDVIAKNGKNFDRKNYSDPEEAVSDFDISEPLNFNNSKNTFYQRSKSSNLQDGRIYKGRDFINSPLHAVKNLDNTIHSENKCVKLVGHIENHANNPHLITTSVSEENCDTRQNNGEQRKLHLNKMEWNNVVMEAQSIQLHSNTTSQHKDTIENEHFKEKIIHNDVSLSENDLNAIDKNDNTNHEACTDGIKVDGKKSDTDIHIFAIPKSKPQNNNKPRQVIETKHENLINNGELPKTVFFLECPLPDDSESNPQSIIPDKKCIDSDFTENISLKYMDNLGKTLNSCVNNSPQALSIDKEMHSRSNARNTELLENKLEYSAPAIKIPTYTLPSENGNKSSHLLETFKFGKLLQNSENSSEFVPLDFRKCISEERYTEHSNRDLYQSDSCDINSTETQHKKKLHDGVMNFQDKTEPISFPPRDNCSINDSDCVEIIQLSSKGIPPTPLNSPHDFPSSIVPTLESICKSLEQKLYLQLNNEPFTNCSVPSKENTIQVKFPVDSETCKHYSPGPISQNNEIVEKFSKIDLQPLCFDVKHNEYPAAVHVPISVGQMAIGGDKNENSFDLINEFQNKSEKYSKEEIEIQHRKTLPNDTVPDTAKNPNTVSSSELELKSECTTEIESDIVYEVHKCQIGMKKDKNKEIETKAIHNTDDNHLPVQMQFKRDPFSGNENSYHLTPKKGVPVKNVASDKYFICQDCRKKGSVSTENWEECSRSSTLNLEKNIRLSDIGVSAMTQTFIDKKDFSCQINI